MFTRFCIAMLVKELRSCGAFSLRMISWSCGKMAIMGISSSSSRDGFLVWPVCLYDRSLLASGSSWPTGVDGFSA